ncbi:uncharacterized protein [Miscanthus floridulus]|uniref:uncharacterized protein n=1 Tax=Miscanthus floridulus TaxID=154761 RepID=UPI003458030C
MGHERSSRSLGVGWSLVRGETREIDAGLGGGTAAPAVAAAAAACGSRGQRQLRAELRGLDGAVPVRLLPRLRDTARVRRPGERHRVGRRRARARPAGAQRHGARRRPLPAPGLLPRTQRLHIQALFSKSYAPGSQNALVVRACSPASPSHTSNCSDGNRYLDRSSQCNTTEPIRCVLPPVVPPPISSGSDQRFFNRAEMQTLAAECTGLVSAASYWDAPAPAPALLLGVMELEWWVVGETCRCSRHATCTLVTTPIAGQRAFRCECPEGYDGDGFADGTGCRRAPKCNPSKYLSGHCGKTIPIALLVAGIMFGAMVTGVTCLAYQLLKRRSASIRTKLSTTYVHTEKFTLQVLRVATGNFAAENKLGEGGFGEVFKGRLQDGQCVAVKRLSKGSSQGFHELKNELILAAKLAHKNLVQLLGVCLEETEKLIVYEYLPNRSLDTILFGRRQQQALDWSKRYTIISGIARGLLYLHEGSRLRIIHRDLKPSNVLLDSDMTPKISDFGLATAFWGDETREVTRRPVGTLGYMSPEYAYYGHVSTKSDMFSFGVIVLEIVTGQRNSSPSVEDGSNRNLLSYLWEKWRRGSVAETVDASLGGQYARTEALACVQIGLLCVQKDPRSRPDASEVVLMLDGRSAILQKPSRPAFCSGSISISGASSRRAARGNAVSFGRRSAIGPVSENSVTVSELEPRRLITCVEIPLDCDQANGTAWLGGARELGLLVSNVTVRALFLTLRPNCSRRLNASLEALFTKTYAPGRQNALVVSSCRPASLAADISNCSVHPSAYLDNSSQCGRGAADSIRCVVPTQPTSDDNIRVPDRFFNRTEMQTLAAECTGLVSAVSYWDAPAPALLLATMELEWWMLGPCRCSRQANCTRVTTPDARQEAFRCECREGFA